LRLGASENFHRIHRRWSFPDEQVPPAVCQLGVELPERFMRSSLEPAPDPSK